MHCFLTLHVNNRDSRSTMRLFVSMRKRETPPKVMTKLTAGKDGYQSGREEGEVLDEEGTPCASRTITGARRSPPYTWDDTCPISPLDLISCRKLCLSARDTPKDNVSFAFATRTADTQSEAAAVEERGGRERQDMNEESMEEEGHMDLSEAAAGLVQAALRIAAPRVLLPGDTSEMPDHLSRAKLGKSESTDRRSKKLANVFCGAISMPFSREMSRRQRARQCTLTSKGSKGHQSWDSSFSGA